MRPKLKIPIAIALLTLCASHTQAAPESLAWNLLPENTEDLPLEIDYDNADDWDEIWLRSGLKPRDPPRTVMEQSLGVKWIGLNPDASGKPGRVVLVFNEKNIVDMTLEKTAVGKIDSRDLKISWADGTQTNLQANRSHRGRRKRSRAARKIHFGKITLPPVASRPKELSAISVYGMDAFLSGKLSPGPAARLYEPGASLLKIRYDNSCNEKDKIQLETIIAQDVEPQLTCWAQQNPDKAVRLYSALLQKPHLNCRLKKSTGEVCGVATLPFVDSFFAVSPRVDINLDCEDINQTLLHEVLHLAGVKDGDEMDAAVTQANSCSAEPAELTFDGGGDEFFNDLQVETRVLLFRKVRDEATAKWGWTEAEKGFVLGSICSRMGDKFCARRFFQMATESGGTGMISLPEGGEITFSAAAHFGLFDSVTEDNLRMHELAKYLAKDPNGTLLKRMETETHRLHEFFVARDALEHVKNNKGVCSSDVDDRISCEDLAQIIKYPWFKN